MPQKILGSVTLSLGALQADPFRLLKMQRGFLSSLGGQSLCEWFLGILHVLLALLVVICY